MIQTFTVEHTDLKLRSSSYSHMINTFWNAMYILVELEKTAIKTYKITKKICSQGTALIHYLRTS